MPFIPLSTMQPPSVCEVHSGASQATNGAEDLSVRCPHFKMHRRVVYIYHGVGKGVLFRYVSSNTASVPLLFWKTLEYTTQLRVQSCSVHTGVSMYVSSKASLPTGEIPLHSTYTINSTLQGEQCVMSSLYSCFVMAVYCTYVPSFTVVVVRHVLTSYIRLAM